MRLLVHWSSMQLLFLFGFLSLISFNDHHHVVLAFGPPVTAILDRHNNGHFCYQRQALAALGDFSLELEKPLGIILEERQVGTNGVRVKEIRPEGSAASSRMVPGDVLVHVGDQNVENLDFDTIMDLIVSSPPKVRLTVGDGLGILDMPRNVVSLLKSKEDAYFIDAVVREAVREIRRNGRLGDLLKVEVIVGAGVQKDGTRGLVRFFAIFSTDGVSTYSCNVASTGIRQSDGTIKIVSLSCAKDEGLGQTFDLIKENENNKS